MNINKYSDIKATLSTLWLFVILNVLFRDIHEFFRVGLLEDMMDGVVAGTVITNELMLIAGIALELSIAMVLLARVLPYRFNRWSNIVIAILTMLSLINTGTNDMDDVWFLVMELIGLCTIIWMAWRWQAPDVQQANTVLQTS